MGVKGISDYTIQGTNSKIVGSKVRKEKGRGKKFGDKSKGRRV